MSDVRAAAKRLLKTDAWYPRDRRHVEIMTPDWENALALAHMVLAEHPADEEEPVTADWLESIGFCRVDRGMRIDTPFAGQHHLRHTNVFRHDDGQWWANGLGCSECKTRSDVRRLCKALGVEVKE